VPRTSAAAQKSSKGPPAQKKSSKPHRRP
jgi:hypothetical protein